MSRRTEETELAMEDPAESAFEENARGGGVGFGPALLLVVGALLLTAGLVLGFAPHYSWRVTKLAKLLVSYGLDPVLVGSAGFVLLSLGLLGSAIVRRIRSLAQPQAEIDVRLIVDQVVLEVAQLEKSITAIAQSVDAFRASQESMVGQIQTGGGEDHEKRYDSIFRMAASLDHVHAKLDERLGSVSADLNRRLASLSETVLEGRNALGKQIKQELETTMRLVAELLAGARGAGAAAPPRAAVKAAAPAAPAAPASQAKPVPKATAKRRPVAPGKHKPVEPAPRPVPEDIYASPAASGIDLGDELEVLVDFHDPSLPAATEAEIFEDLEQIDSLVLHQEDAPEGEANEFDLESLLPEDSLRRVIEEERQRRQG